jgi:Bax protein
MHQPLTPRLPALFLLTTLALAGHALAVTERTGPAPGADTGDSAARQPAPEVLVFDGFESIIAWLESEQWWGEEVRDRQLTVPHVIITGINPAWRVNAQKLPVQQKKELFYRLMLPLVMHANGMVIELRAGLLRAREELGTEGALSPESLALLKRLAILLPGIDAAQAADLSAQTPELADMIEGLIYRVDTVPAGLALGQAAYESGYGTSRFAVEGNSLFGQWTYKGDGIVPRQQRRHLGNHQIRAFDWPFDSVRGYFINLMSHPAYEDFRRLRAELRAAGKPLASLVLADGLLRYSERGQEYVDLLKGIIRKNSLDSADSAVFRDEPLRFIVTVQSPEAAATMAREIEQMRASGELWEIVESMRLE